MKVKLKDLKLSEITNSVLYEDLQYLKYDKVYSATEDDDYYVIDETSYGKGLLMPKEWFEEVKELLTDEEREYLYNVVKPFRNRVECITRSEIIRNSNVYEYIAIVYEDLDKTLEQIKPPYYKKGSMYKGMKLNKEYTLKELGIEENK